MKVLQLTLVLSFKKKRQFRVSKQQACTFNWLFIFICF